MSHHRRHWWKYAVVRACCNKKTPKVYSQYIWSTSMKWNTSIQLMVARTSDKSIVEGQCNSRYPLPQLKRKYKNEKFLHIISLKHCTGIILRCQPWKTNAWASLKMSIIISCTAQMFTCCCNGTLLTYCIIFCQTNRCCSVSEYFVLPKLSLCLCFPLLGCTVYCGVLCLL